MNLVEVIIKLYDFFLEKHEFELDKDYKKIFLISDDEIKDKALLEVALDNLEKGDLVKKIIKKDEKGKNDRIFYFLKKPLQHYSQQIEISAGVAKVIAEAINKFCDATNNDSEKCNPLSVNEKDIVHLLCIIDTFLNKGQDEENKNE